MPTKHHITPGEPSCLLRRRFNDMESVAESLGWVQGFCQLETGKLNAEACVVGDDSCRAVRISFDRSFHQRGKPPGPYLWFGLPDLCVDSLRVGGIDVTPAPLVDFNYTGGLDVTSNGYFSGTMLALRPELLAQVEKLDCTGPARSTQVGSRPYWDVANHHADALREVVNSLFNNCDEPDYADWLREHRSLFDFELAAAILQVICIPEHPLAEPSSSRHRTVKRALKVLEEDDTFEMTIAGLCKASNASMSTLNRAFKEEFGVAPKTYMRMRRLAAVQRELVHAQRDVRVVDVANTLGFWHMGSFAADYKKQFEELPSETLVRPLSST